MGFELPGQIFLLLMLSESGIHGRLYIINPGVRLALFDSYDETENEQLPPLLSSSYTGQKSKTVCTRGLLAFSMASRPAQTLRS